MPRTLHRCCWRLGDGESPRGAPAPPGDWLFGHSAVTAWQPQAFYHLGSFCTTFHLVLSSFCFLLTVQFSMLGIQCATHICPKSILSINTNFEGKKQNKNPISFCILRILLLLLISFVFSLIHLYHSCVKTSIKISLLYHIVFQNTSNDGFLIKTLVGSRKCN